MAVYRTLGIGLGFNFEHLSKINDVKLPSIRRLQSRAAKSAIRRVNDIYNTERATATLKDISDPSEHQKRASTIQQEAEMEVKKLADRLTDLVPAGLSWDESESEIKVEQFHTGSYLGSPKQKYKLPSIETESPALKNLFQKYTTHQRTAGESYEIDYLDPMGVHDLQSDDEFVSEWSMYNQWSNAGITKNSDDDDESSIETILV